MNKDNMKKIMEKKLYIYYFTSTVYQSSLFLFSYCSDLFFGENGHKSFLKWPLDFFKSAVFSGQIKTLL